MFLAAGNFLSPSGYVFVPEHSLLCFSAYQVNKLNRRGKIFCMNWCLPFKNFCLMHTRACSHGNLCYFPLRLFPHRFFSWSPEVSRSYRLNMLHRAARWHVLQKTPVHTSNTWKWSCFHYSRLRWLVSLQKKLSTPLPGAVSRAIESRTTIAVSLNISAAEDTLGVLDRPHPSLLEQLHSAPANAATFELCGAASMVSGSWTWASVSDKNLSLEFWKKLRDCH